jgi:hypothetical protein
MFPRTRCRGAAARVPPIVRLGDIGCGWPLGVTILAVVKTVFGAGGNTERHAKAIGLYIGAAAKRAWIKFLPSDGGGGPLIGIGYAAPRLLTSIFTR